MANVARVEGSPDGVPNPVPGPGRASPIELSEILTALLAHGRACQNWLAAPELDLDRARRSVEQLLAEGHRLRTALSPIERCGPLDPHDDDPRSLQVARRTRSERPEPAW